MFGTSKKIDIRLGYGKVPSLDPNAWWGYRIDHSQSDPAVTLIGNPTLLSTMPVHSQIKAAVIKDDETVNYILNPSDFNWKLNGNAADLTGADGQVMIYKPAYYRRLEVNGDIMDIKWSLLPLPGFSYSQAYWIGQQLGYIDGAGKLCSVHGVMPTTSKHRDEFRQAARLRGSNNWCVFPYEVWEFINDAFRMKYATLHSQDAAALGAGATNASSTDWNNFNGYNPVVACGLKLSLDDAQVPFSVANFVGGTNPLNSNAACFYGIEHVFGHIWQWVDGLNLNYLVEEQKAYISKNPNDFADDTAAMYYEVEGLTLGSGYIKKTADGLIPSVSAGAASNTYYCDYHYSPAAGVGWRGAFAGGNLNNGANAGLAYSNFNNAASNRNANLGSHLCLYKIEPTYTPCLLAKYSFTHPVLVVTNEGSE